MTSKVQWLPGTDWGTRHPANHEELLESDEDGREYDENASEDAQEEEGEGVSISLLTRAMRMQESMMKMKEKKRSTTASQACKFC